MSNITASMVKELRERTGAGMMECKKILAATNGDLEAAIEKMRVEGLTKADKKASRVAAEGLIAIATSADGKTAAMLEVNCETDFVAKGDDFKTYAQNCANTALAQNITAIDALSAADIGGISADERRREMIAKIGENMALRRVTQLSSTDGQVYSYIHGGKIGVLVAITGGDANLGKDVALHIAASNPVCLSADEVSEELKNKEREIFTAQALESGKPAAIVEKMVEGRIQKFLGEVTLLGQPFVKNGDLTIAQLLKNNHASVSAFLRFGVGEGIEKEVVDFAAEVAAQAAAATGK